MTHEFLRVFNNCVAAPFVFGVKKFFFSLILGNRTSLFKATYSLAEVNKHTCTHTHTCQGNEKSLP